ncbi:MAG: hypothetical protein LBC96_08955 [Lachnospiraceae bacterium]|jgi:hypothetical protein|nr:hypothetical protein [Lachnospiraceae bacterium]
MEYISKTIGSSALDGIFEIPPMLRNRTVQVIVLPVDNAISEQAKPKKRPLGFAKGAEVPDSFFEPLSEEELQAWGL